MREFATPLTVEVAPTGNLTDDVVTAAAEEPDVVLFRRPQEAGWVDVTADAFLRGVAAVAKGLIAAGVEPGDRVALVSRTRYEWTLVDYAIWFAGAVTVPVYETSSAEQLRWVLRDSGPGGRRRGPRPRRPDRRRASGAVGAAPRVVARGRRDRRPGGPGGRRRRRRPRGTTDHGDASRPGDPPLHLRDHGPSQGVHADARQLHGRGRGRRRRAARALLPRSAAATRGRGAPRGDRPSTLLFLPLAHVFARVVQLGCVRARVCLGHTADVSSLSADLAAFRPTFVLAVPRVFEKLFNTASQRATADGRRATFDRAAAVAMAWSMGLDKGRPSLAVRAQHAALERVYRRLRDVLGGHCRYAVAGGAPLGDRLAHFYRGIGITVLEGYGLTETTAAVTVNLPDLLKIGSVGRPYPA